MNPAASSLIDAFVEAYGPYVRSRVEDVAATSVDGIPEAIAVGSDALRSTLTELLDRPFPEQSRGPLEVFQEAMEHPTQALREAGVQVADRDEVAVNALPGDVYGIAPAASHELGETAWAAHLAWGAAKARAMRPEPSPVGLLSRNLMDRSKLESAFAAAQRPVTIVAADDVPDGLAALVVDLEHPDADSVIVHGSQRGVSIVAYGPHADTERRQQAEELGATTVVARSRVLVDPTAFVARLAL